MNCKCLYLLCIVFLVFVTTTFSQGPVGGDRDEHGCIPSAGYICCEALNECVRPWMLSKENEQINNLCLQFYAAL